MVRNSAVVEDHGALRTLISGTPGHPGSLVTADPGSWFWPGDGVVEGQELRLFMTRFRATGGGWFRLMPYALSRWMLQKVNREDREPASPRRLGLVQLAHGERERVEEHWERSDERQEADDEREEEEAVEHEPRDFRR